jgi:exosortase
MLFILTGTPAYRISDVVFALPGLTIEVAEACSGIRSTLGIFIVTTLAAYLSLRSRWKRTVLVLLVIPISLLKNAVRIVTLSLLAIHLDMGFITGNLHHEGGIFFMMFGLCLMYPVLILLMRSEKKEFNIGVRS